MCEVDGSLQEKLKKFRFRKETNNAAILSESDSDLCECVQTPDAHSALVLLSEDRHAEAAGGAGGRIRGQCDPAAALRVRRSKVISPVCVCVSGHLTGSTQRRASRASASISSAAFMLLLTIKTTF